MIYCPLCTEKLINRFLNDRDRLVCPSENCEFVLWDNPVPVVAAIVEYEGKVILANNVTWPEHVYALITGYLEKDESPEDGVIREVAEELGLEAEIGSFIGTYTFFRKNQLILAYHVTARGSIRLNEELRSYICVKKDELTYWDAGTGHALRDWLTGQGYNPAMKSLW